MAIEQLRTIVVGLGHQSVDDHIPALLESRHFKLVAVCDADASKCASIASKLDVYAAPKLEEYLDAHSGLVDCALVAVPHASYVPIIEVLAKRGINIIKEKPFATSASNAVEIGRIVRDANVSLIMTLQRRYNPVFTGFRQLVHRIGDVHSIEARYVMDVKRLDDGWRASRLHAGGGALIDLGYHYIDLIVWYFGLPDVVNCHVTSGNRDNQHYDVEDTVFLQFSFDPNEDRARKILGNLVVSRVFPVKEERMVAYGTRGHATVQRGLVSRSFEGPDGVRNEERLERHGAWPSALVDQLENCAEIIRKGSSRGKIDDDYFRHIAFVEAAYESARLEQPCMPSEYFARMKADLESA